MTCDRSSLVARAPFPYEGVIFDFDGTLADSMGVWRWVDEQFLARRGLIEPDGYNRTLAELGFERSLRYVIDVFGLDDTPQEIKDEWNDLALERYSTSVHLKPGARDYLERIRESALAKMAIATTLTPTLLQAALDNNGIAELFDAKATGPEVPCDKSQPDIYQLAADRVGVPPHRCLVFEDIAPGIQSAQSIGMTAVGVRDDTGHQDFSLICSVADDAIESFEELLP
ncbi:MAG: HAD family hydrolase [Coriobacteriales bacterium]